MYVYMYVCMYVCMYVYRHLPGLMIQPNLEDSETLFGYRISGGVAAEQ